MSDVDVVMRNKHMKFDYSMLKHFGFMTKVIVLCMEGGGGGGDLDLFLV